LVLLAGFQARSSLYRDLSFGPEIRGGLSEGKVLFGHGIDID
jgi:hypothetical protein